MLVGLLIIVPLIASLLVFFTKGNTSSTLSVLHVTGAVGILDGSNFGLLVPPNVCDKFNQ
jgi:hypothetical protein